MKNNQISEIKNMLFPSDFKLKVKFKRKNMFRETIVHKWDTVTIHFRLLYTIPRTLNTLYRFYRTSRDHKQHHQLCFTIECERLPGLPPFWKILYCNLLCHWSVEQICGLKVFRGWMVPHGCFQAQHFIRSRQAHFKNRWHKFHSSIREFFGCMDDNLAWLYFSENDIFDGSAYAIHWAFPMVSLIAEPAQWLIQEHCSY